MTSMTYPTRRPQEGRRLTLEDRRYGERDGRRLCEFDIGFEPDWMSGLPTRDDPWADVALCANLADVLWVGPSGSLKWTCSVHVPCPDDELLKPKQAAKVLEWATFEWTVTHPLTGLKPVALERCTPEVLERATAVAWRLAQYDLLPKTDEVSEGFLGTLEDEARLRAAGEET